MPNHQPSKLSDDSKSLRSLYPDIAAQWHPTKNDDLTPEEVTASSKRWAWWVCDRGHDFKCRISGHILKEGRCPYCSGARILSGFNDLETLLPEIAVLWHPTKNDNVLASEVSKGSKKYAWWLCSQGHETKTRIVNKVSSNGRCSVCSGYQVLAGFNDLATTHPELVSEWHPNKNDNLTPQQVTAGYSKKVWWKCSTCTGEWDTVLSNRTRKKPTGCPYCAGQKVQQGLNDLATTHPELSAQWHPTLNGNFTPQMARMGSPAKVWWKCDSGHEWRTQISDRVRGYGCSQCYRQQLPSDSISLAEGRPDLAKEWDYEANLPFTPETITFSSSRKMWWICEKDNDHRWLTTVANRTTKLSNCPVCWTASSTSQAETDLYATVVSLGFPEAERHVRTVLDRRAELDIYLPKKKLAVEFNGGYWHSEAAGKTKNYHLDKWQKCQDEGITLIQVWEDDWFYRRSIVIRGIAHKLGATHRLPEVLPDLPSYYTERIGARKLEIVELDFKDASVFLEEHHIQGSVAGSYYYGLQDAQERLRAVIVLTKTGVPGEWLISRYASAGVVSGGFTRLLSHAEKQIKPEKWITFADLSISDGALYENTGFTRDKILPPDYSYLVGKQRVHKFNYRIDRFRKDDTLEFEEGLTESELATLNGLYRVWDTGKIRYVKEVA